MLWLTQGFAVLARAAMPIVAREGAAMRTANDTFVAQLVGAAEAAVAHVCDELGVGDRQRVAVGLCLQYSLRGEDSELQRRGSSDTNS